MKLYHWPGNVRELSNLVDRFSTLFAGQRLELRSFPKNLLPKEMAVFKAQIENGEIPVPAESAASAIALEQALEPLQWHVQNNVVTGGIFDVQEDVPALPAGLNTVEALTFLSQDLAVLPPEGLSLKHRLAEIERDLIKQALSRTQGNVSQAARILNVQRTTLIEKIQKFGLQAA
jgi:sigma-54 specific flagellar transcriptional regulator A